MNGIFSGANQWACWSLSIRARRLLRKDVGLLPALRNHFLPSNLLRFLAFPLWVGGNISTGKNSAPRMGPCKSVPADTEQEAERSITGQTQRQRYFRVTPKNNLQQSLKTSMHGCGFWMETFKHTRGTLLCKLTSAVATVHMSSN